MREFIALPAASQIGPADDVLFYRASARPDDLYETGETRISYAIAMLEAVSLSKGEPGADNAPAIAGAAALLLSDARGLFAGFYAAAVKAQHTRSLEGPNTGRGIATFPKGGGEKYDARRSAYTVALLKLYLRHATDTESALILQQIEAAVTTALSVHYRQGLNASAYELFQRYALKKEGA